jgi:hypothetical protein
MDDRKYQTALTRFVETKWRVSGLNQTDFVKDGLGLNLKDFGRQTLSKYIHGRLAAVPQGLIEALSERYDVPVEHLEAMAVTAAEAPLSRIAAGAGDGPVLEFVLGHTAWAASFLIAMLNVKREGETITALVANKGVRLASRKCIASEKLDWIRADGDEVEPDLDAPAPSWEPLSAPAVAELLEDPESDMATGAAVTFGILPWEIAAERQRLQRCDGHYIRLATLMDSAAACSVIVPAHADIDLSGQADNNTLTSGALVRWLAEPRDPQRRIVLAEQGTIAGEQAYRIAELAQKLALKHDAQIVWEHCATTSWAEKNWDDLSEMYPGLAAIVTWDPQATGLVRRSRKVKVARYNLVDVHGRQNGPGHTTFDIVLFLHRVSSRAPGYQAWRQSAEMAARRLFESILPAIQRQEASLANLAGADRDAIEILKAYFAFDDLSSQEIARIFANLRFSASIDPTGMREVLNMEINETE